MSEFLGTRKSFMVSPTSTCLRPVDAYHSGKWWQWSRFIETPTVLLPRAEANLTLISPQDQNGAASGAICRLLFPRTCRSTNQYALLKFNGHTFCEVHFDLFPVWKINDFTLFIFVNIFALRNLKFAFKPFLGWTYKTLIFSFSRIFWCEYFRKKYQQESGF